MDDDALNRLSAYDFDLPDELIAAYPASERGQSTLVVADVEQQTFSFTQFDRIVEEHLRPGDLLVFNDVKVIRARVSAQKPTGGKVELFVIELLDPTDWETRGDVKFRCMTRASKPLRVGSLSVGDLDLYVDEISPGEATVTVHDTSAHEFLARYGEVPLPPYIVRRRQALGRPDVERADVERYQTVFARTAGAVAAPTAGLHFTEDRVRELESFGIEHASLTLFVGPGTFKPVTAETLDEHEMHRERYVIPEGLRERIEETKRRGGRVIAVGTTSARTLEAEARDHDFSPGERSTDIFIRPGFDWKVCDGLITNFHLPKSTLLALVYSFAGSEFTRAIYEEAIRRSLRFYSYGDVIFFFRQP